MTQPEFSRLVPVDRIVRNALSETIEAHGDELRAIAERLKIEAMNSLSGRFELRYVKDLRMFEVEGEVNAALTQICVVSGEAFPSEVMATIRSRFTTDRGLLNQFVPDAFSEWDDPELIENGAIDIGELAVQHIALALDSYPRKPDVIWPDAGETEKPPSPFAVLEGLKKK